MKVKIVAGRGKISVSKLSKFSFPNCQIFLFQTVKISLSKLSKFVEIFEKFGQKLHPNSHPERAQKKSNKNLEHETLFHKKLY
jgi:hypothetical protein